MSLSVCRHAAHQLTCIHCAPLFSSLYVAKTWVVQECQQRGGVPVGSLALHYDCQVLGGHLIFPVSVAHMHAWVRTPWANHSSQRTGAPKLTSLL
jgi:hypothetical protein